MIESQVQEQVLKNSTGSTGTNNKCYAFASAALLRPFSLQTLKSMINIWPT